MIMRRQVPPAARARATIRGTGPLARPTSTRGAAGSEGAVAAAGSDEAGAGDAGGADGEGGAAGAVEVLGRAEPAVGGLARPAEDGFPPAVEGGGPPVVGGVPLPHSVENGVASLDAGRLLPRAGVR